MEDKNENFKEEQTIMEYLNKMKAFISTKNKNDKDNLYEKLQITKTNLTKSNIPENIVRAAIINYIINYANIISLSKDKDASELLNEFIEFFPKKNVIEKSLNVLNKKFIKPSPLAALISFRKEINKEKNYLEFYFKVMILLQNINDIIEGIIDLLSIKNNIIKETLQKLNFQNPYAVLLIRDLINEMIVMPNEIEVENVLKEVINNIKCYYPFYCPNCFEILLVVYDKDISLYCPKERAMFCPKDVIELKDKLIFNIKCKNCNKIIEMYDNNYKCNDCKYFYCQECAREHEKSDIKNVLLNIYEIGYICEEHCELYSTFCNICQINLCQTCKENHVHKLDIEMLSLNESLLKSNSSKNLDKITKIKEYLLTRLSLMFKYMRNFSFNNYTIRVSLWFGEKYNRDNSKEREPKKFYFANFFGDDFKKYYSKLIKNVLKGKKTYYNLLISIKKEYEKSGYNIDSSFNNIVEKYSMEKSNRKQDINDYILNFRFSFKWLELYSENIKLNNKIISLNNQSLKFWNEIKLLKIKIIALLKSNKLYSSYLLKIINRYLSDFLLRKIIEKYPSKFSPIQISHKNFYEIANNFGEVMFKKDKDNSFLTDLRNKLYLENNKNGSIDKEKIKKFIEDLKDNNKIIFIDSVEINNEIFSANEMNYVLDTLFYFRSPGNIIAHMNIKPKESIKLKKIERNIPDIMPFLKNIDIFDSNNNSNNISNGINTNSNIIININEINNTNNQKEIILNDKNEINQNEPNIILSDEEIAKKIISNIEKNQQDWLEIKDDIIKDTINLISTIKKEILSDFYDSSINEILNITDIINCIFKNKFSNMFTENSAFTRALSSTIDNMIKYENININFSKYDEIKDLIRKFHIELKSLDKWKNKLKQLNLELSEKIYQHSKNYVKNYINNLCSENPETKFISIKESYSQIFEDLTEKNILFPYFDKNETRMLIISLILPVIKRIELKNLDLSIKGFKNSIKNYYIIYNVKRIIETLYNEIESSINIEIENNQIEDIKKYVASRANSYSDNIDLIYEKISDIIKKIFEGENIQWTKLSNSDISLESLLFFYQNK